MQKGKKRDQECDVLKDEIGLKTRQMQYTYVQTCMHAYECTALDSWV